MKLLDTIYNNMDKGKLTGVVLLDLKKAFNTVNHTILLNKLHSFNIDDHAINWFSNYLCG